METVIRKLKEQGWWVLDFTDGSGALGEWAAVKIGSEDNLGGGTPRYRYSVFFSFFYLFHFS